MQTVIDMQKLLDALGVASRNTRKNYHLTLGRLIGALESTAAGTPVEFDKGGAPGEPDSYRGYYEDLAFERTDQTTTDALLAACRKALGATFQGYKGGDFVMRTDTPLWVASYGCCGDAIVGTHERDGKLILVTKSVDG